MPRHIPRALRPSTRYAAIRAQLDATHQLLQQLSEQIAQSRPITVFERVDAEATAREIARLNRLSKGAA